MTVLLELPDEAAERFLALSEEKRQSITDAAVAVLLDWLDREEENEIPFTLLPVRPENLSSEDIAAIEEGLSDSDAGRVIDGQTFFARHFQRVGLPIPPNGNERQ